MLKWLNWALRPFKVQLHRRGEMRKAIDDARRDPMTGLFNRRMFDEVTTTLTEGGTAFSIVMFDLANLHPANEALGHWGADRLLQDAARTIRRSTDIACRTGGDEFVVILPEEPWWTAEIVRTRVEDDFGFRQLAAGVSAFVGGYAVAWEIGESVEALMNRASQGLHRHKRAMKEARGEVTTRVEAMARVKEAMA